MNINKAKELGYDKVYFTFDCIGDTILLMSGLKYIYEKEKKRILVGTYYKELLENCDYIEILDDFCEDIFDKKVYDELIKNGIQPIFISATDFINENDKIRPIWGKYHILANVCSKLGVESEIQISPEFYLTEKEKQNGRFFEKAQIAIVSAGNQRYKAIPYEMAQQIVNELNDKYGFVQVGSPSDPVISGVLDKRGKGGLRGTASILYNSDLYVGGIGGLMHMARAVECKSVIAFSRAEPIALENYICNINVIPKRKCCTLCGDNVQFPYLSTCHNDYSCIRNIDVKDVINAVEVQINNRNRNVEVERMFVPSKKVSGIEDYIRRFGGNKMMKCKVSVIVPIYNTQEFLGECLDSIIGQTYKNIEVICVDDGSTDSSPKIIDSYMKRDDRIIKIEKNHTNAGDSRNMGIDVAKGDYLLFLDSDDFVNCNLVKKLVEHIDNNESDIVVYKYKLFDNVTKSLESEEFGYENIDQSQVALLDIKQKRFEFTNIAVWNKIYRAKFIQSNNIKFKSQVAINDLFFSWSALVLATRISVCDIIGVYYRKNRDTSISSNIEMVGRCLVNAFTEINTFIIENNKWEELHNDLFSAERGQLIEYQNRIENTDMKNKGEVMQLIKKFMQNFFEGRTK